MAFVLAVKPVVVRHGYSTTGNLLGENSEARVDDAEELDGPDDGGDEHDHWPDEAEQDAPADDVVLLGLTSVSTFLVADVVTEQGHPEGR